MNENRHIAVIGAGIAGLATAYFLTRRGCRPVIFDGADRPGGMGSSFDHEGVAIDRFYHVILDTDTALRALIEEMGLTGRLAWRETGMGFHIDGRLFPFNTTRDLLRFSALSWAERLRVACGALYVTMLNRHGLDLDETPVGEWVRRVFGGRVVEHIWTPLLRAKFGDAAGTIPALWLWSLLRREKNGGKELKGYLRGGYQQLADALAAAIVRAGGEIRLGSPLEELEQQPDGAFSLRGPGTRRSFAQVVSTVPMEILHRIARGPIVDRLPLSELRYQGVVNALLLLRRRLGDFYWTVVVEPDTPFQGVVETTHVIPPDWVGGRHLVYTMNYCSANSDLYRTPDEQVRRDAVAGLCRLYPHLDAGDVEKVYVFRTPQVEPVWTLGYLQQRPGPCVADSGLYLCTTAQVYPRVTAWNTSVLLARETVDAICERARAPSLESGRRAGQRPAFSSAGGLMDTTEVGEDPEEPRGTATAGAAWIRAAPVDPGELPAGLLRTKGLIGNAKGRRPDGE